MLKVKQLIIVDEVIHFVVHSFHNMKAIICWILILIFYLICAYFSIYQEVPGQHSLNSREDVFGYDLKAFIDTCFNHFCNNNIIIEDTGNSLNWFLFIFKSILIGICLSFSQNSKFDIVPTIYDHKIIIVDLSLNISKILILILQLFEISD